ncbi:chorismate mutase [candidate division KSB1 bacterium]|nr:chorismate mutase [candidate division KSB1 bacterium]
MKLLALINQRAAIAQQIGQEKTKLNLPVFDSSREQAILQNLSKNNSGPLSDTAIQAIFRSIIQVCTELQKNEKTRIES